MIQCNISYYLFFLTEIARVFSNHSDHLQQLSNLEMANHWDSFNVKSDLTPDQGSLAYTLHPSDEWI